MTIMCVCIRARVHTRIHKNHIYWHPSYHKYIYNVSYSINPIITIEVKASLERNIHFNWQCVRELRTVRDVSCVRVDNCLHYSNKRYTKTMYR